MDSFAADRDSDGNGRSKKAVILLLCLVTLLFVGSAAFAYTAFIAKPTETAVESPDDTSSPSGGTSYYDDTPRDKTIDEKADDEEPATEPEAEDTTVTAGGSPFVQSVKKPAVAPPVSVPSTPAPVTQPPVLATCSDPAIESLMLKRQNYTVSFGSASFQLNGLRPGYPMTGTDDLATVYSIDGGEVIRSTDGGRTWSVFKTSVDYYYNDITVANDGQLIVLLGRDTDFNPVLFRSTDAGINWEQLDQIPVHSAPTANATGSVLVAYGSRGGFFGGLSMFVSTNAGTTWTERTYPGASVRGLSVSADGSTITASGDNQEYTDQLVYQSDDFGATWNTIDPTTDTLSVRAADFSSDGSIMLISATNTSTFEDRIYRSFDGGDTWDSVLIPDEHFSAEMELSDDGSILLFTAYDFDDNLVLFRSLDQGTTWQQQTITMPSSQSGTPVISRDNSAQYFAGARGEINRFITGTTWQLQPQARQIYDVSAVDLDASQSGQQVMVDRVESEGWRATYDPSNGVITFDIIDEELYWTVEPTALSYTLVAPANCSAPAPSKVTIGPGDR